MHRPARGHAETCFRLLESLLQIPPSGGSVLVREIPLSAAVQIPPLGGSFLLHSRVFALDPTVRVAVSVLQSLNRAARGQGPKARIA